MLEVVQRAYKKVSKVFVRLSVSHGKVCGISLIAAYLAIFYAFFIWPNIVVYYSVKYGLDPAQTESLLQYMVLISAGPVGVYILASLPRKRRGRREDDIDIL